jgi:hypothetical protein
MIMSGILEDPKHEKFAQVYHNTGNKTEAYAQGFGIKNRDSARALAVSVFANVSVQGRLRELEEETLLKCDIDREYIVGALKQVLVKCLGKAVIMETDKDTGALVNIGEKFYDPHAVLKAIDMMNKMTGQYTQKLEITNPYDNKELMDLPPDKLLAIREIVEKD